MQDLIRRNTPEIARAFVLELIEKEDGKGLYEIEAVNGKIVLRGDCKISLAMAYYRYLKDCCGVNHSRCGNTKLHVETAPLPVRKITHSIEQEKRVCMNYRAFSYSACWWGWERWEREIDFMAMNGINMPLSVVGTEAVWFHTLKDFRYSDEGALQFLSGPCTWSWQLMTNLDSNLALTDAEYVENRLQLGKKILKRETELGMSPIMQGYTGHIPRSFIRLHKKARLRHNPAWRNFAVTYQIDPADPLFAKFGKALLEKQLRLLGSSHYYACDPLHDNIPETKSDAYLKSIGKAAYKLISSFDSSAVLVMQSDSLKESLVKTVPKDRLLILDLDGSKHRETNGFWGYDFILGSPYIKGGRNTLHGSLQALADNPYIREKENYTNLAGTGLFPEGLDQNPLYYDLAFEMLTENNPKDLDEWLASYAFRRYGSREDCLTDAVMALKASCYSENCTGSETGSVVCMRPSTELTHTAIGDNTELRYDNGVLYDAADSLLAAKNAHKDGYSYDACDMVRQVLSNHARTLYKSAMDGYLNKDVRLFEISSNAFLRLLEDIDRLLQTREELTLIKRLKDARNAAFKDKEKQNFEINALTQLTLWGPLNDPVLYDTAWREWGGLIKTFYAPRWQSFFVMLAGNFKGLRRVSTVTRKQPFGRNEYRGNGFYKNLERMERSWIAKCSPEEPSAENTLVVARELLEKYRKAILGEGEM